MKRRLLRIAVVLPPVVLVTLFGLSRLGTFLVREDPLQSADAIVVLGGSMYERQLEAVDLYQAGMAPQIFLFREIADWGERVLMQRGIPYLRSVDVQVDAMVKLGVPRDAIIILDQARNTADEAGQLRQLVVARHFSKVIVVTSKQHTRRARLVMNRRTAGTGTTIIVRGSRYDRAPIERWWTQRSTLRFTIFETQRWFGYWIGVAD